MYRDCPIKIQEYEFLGDLIELFFREFDVIDRPKGRCVKCVPKCASVRVASSNIVY